jgi:hypothetical protein
MAAHSDAHAPIALELWLTCPDCGDVVVDAQGCDVYLDLTRDAHLVAYRCPRCLRRGTCTLDDEHVEVLISEGFVVRVLTVAAELREPRPLGPVFQWDDLLAFHELMATDKALPLI